jgi:hypothetical protein
MKYAFVTLATIAVWVAVIGFFTKIKRDQPKRAA